MKIICDKCDYVINRDKYIEGRLIEEYDNIYGTHCPNCGKLIKSSKKLISVNNENKLKIELLKNEIREKLKNKIRRK